jgi:tetratricopeptide (TPR) repeat protein
MVDLGTKRHMIHTAGTMSEARDIIKNNKIGLVLSDYSVGGGSGFDLFKMVRESHDTMNKKLCLVLVTANISQTAVAKAAEEDVDSFIIKPYTLQSIMENLISTISAKVQPPPYVLKIEEGKELIAQEKYEEAIEVFNTAVKMHSRPALALFYMGQAQYLLSEPAKAKGQYNKGLEYNSIHFKCLIGLYEIFMREERFEEAYRVVEKIAKYFPANPDRLTQVIRLTIVTKHYEDMENYYDIFSQLDERSADLVNYVGAGLFVSGKWFLLEGQLQRALAIFDKIAVSCSEFTKFIRAIITTLVEHGHHDSASNYISRFPSGSNDDEDYLVSYYLINHTRVESDAGQAIISGLELFNKNIRDYNCLCALINALEKQGLKDKVNQYKAILNEIYPEKMNLSKVS